MATLCAVALDRSETVAAPKMQQILENGPIHTAANTSIDGRTLFARDPSKPPVAGSVTPGAAPTFSPDDKYILLYFSAHWCPPCRSFTPHLASVYRKLKAQGRDFEVVFCSLDNNLTEFTNYAQTMPWLRLPLGDRRIQQLNSLVGARFIPTLAVFRASDGALVNSNAKANVGSDSQGEHFPWPAGAGGAGSTATTVIWRLVLLAGLIFLVAKVLLR
jgi:thiol-disulfide isomerase/thioredoxin